MLQMIGYLFQILPHLQNKANARLDWAIVSHVTPVS